MDHSLQSPESPPSRYGNTDALVPPPSTPVSHLATVTEPRGYNCPTDRSKMSDFERRKRAYQRSSTRLAPPIAQDSFWV